MAYNSNKPMIIPIFIMNMGCPHTCIFCNQKITAGNHPAEITKEVFDKIIQNHLATACETKKVEIAFYGGNFTGISEPEQERLLSWANYYIHKGLAQEIRISTRPDYISPAYLKILKEYNVATVEIGAQSFVDDVLRYAQRGHDAACAEQAVKLLKENSFHTCLHLMAGLPEDTEDGFLYSLNKAIALKPDMARISPTLVLKDTTLAQLHAQGAYTPLDLNNAVSLCRVALDRFSAAGIRIIRFGLHITNEMRNNKEVIAGPLHPSLGDLVYADFFCRKTLALLRALQINTKTIHIILSSSDVAVLRGVKNSNLAYLQSLYPFSSISLDSTQYFKRGEISIYADNQHVVHTNFCAAAANYQMEAH
ncbi:MAG TPA: radical SAM protein [Smithellaceae bacterium]|nr:radical SAM protein [Smithellaceae bacterium]HRS90027.1 radical SAM protein [Smithellaceae bacterium]HRV26885.1 radical SAM protein [Smithellaceae bacterium]